VQLATDFFIHESRFSQDMTFRFCKNIATPTQKLHKPDRTQFFFHVFHSEYLHKSKKKKLQITKATHVHKPKQVKAYSCTSTNPSNQNRISRAKRVGSCVATEYEMRLAGTSRRGQDRYRRLRDTPAVKGSAATQRLDQNLEKSKSEAPLS
jgi:hypothetical protein